MSKAPRRWIIVSIVIVVLALVAIGSAAYTVTVGQKANRQQAEIIALKARAKATDDLRASEKVAAKLRSQSECRSAIKSTRQGRTIIEDLRATYLELAASTTRPKVALLLKRRAAHLPMFPRPECDPGPKKGS